MILRDFFETLLFAVLNQLLYLKLLFPTFNSLVSATGFWLLNSFLPEPDLSQWARSHFIWTLTCPWTLGHVMHYPKNMVVGLDKSQFVLKLQIVWFGAGPKTVSSVFQFGCLMLFSFLLWQLMYSLE